MFQIREGMILNKGDRVEVYYNLPQGRFSINSLEKGIYKGKVVAYSSSLLMSNGKFVVNESDRKIREEKRKRVCVVVRGTFEGIGTPLNGEDIYFNPYSTDSFIKVSTGEKISIAKEIFFYGMQCEVRE